mmetsp:Transcript_45175/g.96050  ORF Transcript_45175/g.96050 Transcript_45175/m.96050 type:complete len:395 (+) Transcript_45175:677-1861(+)
MAWHRRSRRASATMRITPSFSSRHQHRSVGGPLQRSQPRRRLRHLKGTWRLWRSCLHPTISRAPMWRYCRPRSSRARPLTGLQPTAQPSLARCRRTCLRMRRRRRCRRLSSRTARSCNYRTRRSPGAWSMLSLTKSLTSLHPWPSRRTEQRRPLAQSVRSASRWCWMTRSRSRPRRCMRSLLTPRTLCAPSRRLGNRHTSSSCVHVLPRLPTPSSRRRICRWCRASCSRAQRVPSARSRRARRRAPRGMSARLCSRIWPSAGWTAQGLPSCRSSRWRSCRRSRCRPRSCGARALIGNLRCRWMCPSPRRRRRCRRLSLRIARRCSCHSRERPPSLRHSRRRRLRRRRPRLTPLASCPTWTPMRSSRTKPSATARTRAAMIRRLGAHARKRCMRH